LGGIIYGEVYLNNKGHIKIIGKEPGNKNFSNGFVLYEDNTDDPIPNEFIDIYLESMQNNKHYVYDNLNEMGKQLEIIKYFKILGSKYRTLQSVVNTLNQDNDTLNSTISSLKNEINSMKFELINK
jgi:hypothetical protein